MKRTSVAAMVLGMAVMGTGMARADFLIDPTGGTTIFSDSANYDDAAVQRSLGFTSNFFGTPVTDVYVSTNGNIHFNGLFSGSDEYSNSSLPYSVAIIAPLWDDQEIVKSSGEWIKENATSDYYAVTWNVTQAYSTSSRFQFQVVWFHNATTIGNITFEPNDIVFDYAEVDPHLNNSATVGLNSGTGAYTSYFTSNGEIVDSQTSLVPTGLGDAVLFQPTVEGGVSTYTAAAVNTTAAPEPASLAILALGGLAIQLRRSSRKKA